VDQLLVADASLMPPLDKLPDPTLPIRVAERLALAYRLVGFSLYSQWAER